MGNQARNNASSKGSCDRNFRDCYRNQSWKVILKSLVLGEKVMNAALFIYSLTHERIPSKLFLSTIQKARRNCININLSES